MGLTASAVWINWHKNITYKMAHVLNVLYSYLPAQNGRHFADDIFKYIFMNEKFCILIRISLKFVPKGSIDNNKAALVQVIAANR